MHQLTVLHTRIELSAAEAGVSRRLIHGSPIRHEGQCLVFGPRSFVILMHELARVAPVYVFRTLGKPNPYATVLAGVSPGVHLLSATRSKLAAARILNMLIALSRDGIDPAALSDGFWSKVSVILNGRVRDRTLLSHLLSRESANLQRSV